MIRKTILLTLSVLTSCLTGFAQSRVFTEVGKQIFSTVEPIVQDNHIVGYILFTQLERASKDSFNYKLDFLDENLNDIGNYHFKDIKLAIQEAAVDNDVLLIGYLRSNIPDELDMFGYIGYNKTMKKVRSSVYFQMMSLSGKLITDVSDSVELLVGNDAPSQNFNGHLNNPLQLKNVPGKGFSYTYGDGGRYTNRYFMGYSTDKNKGSEHVGFFGLDGKRLWKTDLPDSRSKGLNLVASNKYIYALRQNTVSAEDGGYEIHCIDGQNGNIIKTIELKDSKDQHFDVLHFSNDLIDNNALVTGTIINPRFEHKAKFDRKMAHARKPLRIGVFSLQVQDTTAAFHNNYWDKNTGKSTIRKDGWIASTNTYLDMTHSFEDEEGNIYFAGSGIRKKTRWVAIGISIVTAPTVLVPYSFLHKGIFKYKYSHLMMLKQNKNGQLSYYTTMKYDNSPFYPGQTPTPGGYAYKRFFSVNQNKYLVLNDVENIYIYDVSKKTAVKTIPHRKGSITANAYQAKDGYIMISEHDNIKKSTRLSIEAL